MKKNKTIKFLGRLGAIGGSGLFGNHCKCFLFKRIHNMNQIKAATYYFFYFGGISALGVIVVERPHAGHILVRSVSGISYQGTDSSWIVMQWP